jgi:hypothetical protein
MDTVAVAIDPMKITTNTRTREAVTSATKLPARRKM